MFTVHIIVRFQYKTLETDTYEKALGFVASQCPQHSVKLSDPNRRVGNFISTNDNSSVVGTYVIN